MPTETVYGLAVDATSDAAVARVFAAKGRPAFNPLIAHVLDIEAAREHAIFGPDAERLAWAFWPGPLTLVLPVAPGCRVSLLARAGLDTLAVRAPAHPVARRLIDAAEVPLAAPSANRSGRVSPTTAAHVLADLDGRIDWIIDGGPSRHGLESTIVACLDAPKLLRPGAIPREAIEAALGRPSTRRRRRERRRARPGNSPRTMRRAPGCASKRLKRQSDEAILDFAGALAGRAALARLDLSPSGDLAEAASNLFAHLRALDASGARTIAAAPIPHRGLGAAINDRLRRAAAPRGG